MTGLALLPDTPAPTPPGAVFVGKIARVIAATSVGVTLDAYGDTHEWPPATWVASGQTPTRGDVVLVFIDDRGELWALPQALTPAPVAGSVVAAIGDGASRAFPIIHGFGSRSVNVTVYTTAAPYSEVTAEVEHTDANTITVHTAAAPIAAPTTGQYTVVVTTPGPLVTTTVLGDVLEVSALPNPATNGQVVDLLVDSAGAYGGPYLWRCRYRAATPGTAKWHVLGNGPPLRVSVVTAGDESTASTTYVALTTPGPAITVPLVGDWIVDLEESIYGTAGCHGLMSYDIGATAAVDADGVTTAVSNTTQFDVQHVHKWKAKTFAAGTVLTAKYRAIGGTATWRNGRYMTLTPVRLGP
jgi:hypothetical protein